MPFFHEALGRRVFWVSLGRDMRGLRFEMNLAMERNEGYLLRQIASAVDNAAKSRQG
jgi:hypothetical protein